jgi:D-threo-aldose 1-dehydrogenase
MTQALPRVPLANGVEVSRVSFGCAALGGLYEAVDKQQALDAVQKALQSGINYFDSALLYGGGRSLEVLGEALGKNLPEDLVISFKVGRVLLDDKTSLPPGKEAQNIGGFPEAEGKQFYYDYSAQGVQKAYEQSLEYLNRSRLDKGWPPITLENTQLMILVHDPGVAEHGDRQPEIMQQVLEEAYPELYRMQQQNKIKAYGLGTNEIGPCVESLRDDHIGFFLPAGRCTLLCNNAPAASEEIKKDSRLLPQFLEKLRERREQALPGKSQPALIAAAIGNSSLGYGGDRYN